MNADEREKQIAEYMTIKKHIKACFNMNAFINIIKECIDKSENFKFSSERSRKFINKNKPIFTLKTTLLKDKDVGNMNTSQLNAELDIITMKINEEIIKPISERMMETLIDPDTYNDLCSVNKDLVDLCITNIYKIRIDSKRSMVQLEYFDF